MVTMNCRGCVSPEALLPGMADLRSTQAVALLADASRVFCSGGKKVGLGRSRKECPRAVHRLQPGLREGVLGEGEFAFVAGSQVRAVLIQKTLQWTHAEPGH